MKPRRRWYCGYLRASGRLEAFGARVEPTEKTHGRRYAAVVGPMSMKQARRMAGGLV